MNMTLLDVAVSATNSKPISQEEAKAMEQLIHGLFSKEMQETVINAPQNNYLMYIFLIVAIVLIIAVIIIMKIAAGGITKGIQQGINPFVNQLQTFQTAFDNSFAVTQRSYENMAVRFSTLTERIIEVQMANDVSEERMNTMSCKLTEIQSSTDANLHHMIMSMTECKENIAHMKHSCSLGWLKKFGNKLVDKGIVSKEDVEKYINELLSET